MLFRVIHQNILGSLPFFILIVNLFKFRFLEFLNISTQRQFFKECSVVIQTSVFQMRCPIFYCKLLSGYFFFYVPN